MQKDQDARRAGDWAAVRVVDAENLPWLKDLIGSRGWPGKSVSGTDGAHAAWLLVQHADEDPVFQRHCLDLLGPAVEAGEATVTELVYLTDRVLLHEGKEQEYGTQAQGHGGRYVPRSLRDPDTVDERRRRAGLGPMAEYLDHMLEAFGPPRWPEIRCPECGADIKYDPPDDYEPVTVTCGGCGCSITVKR